MAARKETRAAYAVASYFASSDEEQEEVEAFEFADFEPFMALFRRYRLELSETEKKQLTHKGLCNTRENPLIENIIRKLFDYD